MKHLLILLLLATSSIVAEAQQKYLGITFNNQITVNVTPSRLGSGGDICAAPCGVILDLTNTTSGLTPIPYHEVDQSCDFGDSVSSGAWVYGTRTSAGSMNIARGPIQSHVYRTAGVFTITCPGIYGSVIGYGSATITVTAADTQWANTATLCIRQTAGGSFATCPSGADTATDSSFANIVNVRAAGGATYKRIVVECDGTYTIATFAQFLSNGPGYVGSHPVDCVGVGRARPILTGGSGVPMIVLGNTTNYTFGDWRFVGLDLNNVTPGGDNSAFYAAGGASRITVLDSIIRNTTNGFNLSPTVLDAINVSSQLVPIWNQFVIQGNQMTVDHYGILAPLNMSAVMGNSIVPADQHGLRLIQGSKNVISNNDLTGSPTGAALTIRGMAWEIADRGGDGNQYTLPAHSYSEYSNVQENKLVGDPAGGVVTYSPPNPTTFPHFRNHLFERNWIITGAVGLPISTQAGGMTIRNNVIRNTSTTDLRNIEVIPTQDTTYNWFYVYNNTTYNAALTSSLQFSAVDANFTGNPLTLTACNNMGVAPSNTTGSTAPVVDYTSPPVATITTCSSANSTRAQIQGPTPLTTTPPTTPAGFQPAAATYPIDAGACVPVWRDFFGALRGTCVGGSDYGAVNP